MDKNLFQLIGGNMVCQGLIFLSSSSMIAVFCPEALTQIYHCSSSPMTCYSPSYLQPPQNLELDCGHYNRQHQTFRAFPVSLYWLMTFVDSKHFHILYLDHHFHHQFPFCCGSNCSDFILRISRVSKPTFPNSPIWFCWCSPFYSTHPDRPSSFPCWRRCRNSTIVPKTFWFRAGSLSYHFPSCRRSMAPGLNSNFMWTQGLTPGCCCWMSARYFPSCQMCQYFSWGICVTDGISGRYRLRTWLLSSPKMADGWCCRHQLVFSKSISSPFVGACGSLDLYIIRNLHYLLWVHLSGPILPAEVICDFQIARAIWPSNDFLGPSLYFFGWRTIRRLSETYALFSSFWVTRHGPTRNSRCHLGQAKDFRRQYPVHVLGLRSPNDQFDHQNWWCSADFHLVWRPFPFLLDSFDSQIWYPQQAFCLAVEVTHPIQASWHCWHQSLAAHYDLHFHVK